MARGTLRIYLGAAPGVGKTVAMLDEAHRRFARGTDVVAAAVETHQRPGTALRLEGLPQMPWRVVSHDGLQFEELDLDAVLARRPQVALVDDLAHRNSPGSRNARRWNDVDELLAAGIDVITTLNVQHIDSLSDVVERITGYGEPHTVPDAFVRDAEQIELVDMSPEALRRRLAHGNVYPAEQVDAALAHFFRPGNLAALRELALLWVADRVDDALQDYRGDHGITRTWETRERVVVALTGAPTGDRLVRRAARIASRSHGELIGVHVSRPNSTALDEGLDRQRSLLTELGGTYREVVSTDVVGALSSFATAEHATQVVLGVTRRSRVRRLLEGSVADDLQRQLDGVDVHIIAADDEGQQPTARTTRPIRAVPRRRENAAWALATIGEPLLTFAVVHLQSHLNLGSALLLQLAFVVAVSAIGGVRPGVLTSVAAFLSTNWFLTPPVHTLSIADTDDLIALGVFVAISLAVSVLVDRTARRSRDALRARADATALARTTGSIIGSDDPMPALVDQLRALFAAACVTIVQRDSDGWNLVASSGDTPPPTPHGGVAIPLDASGETQLVIHGATLGEDDQHVLRAFADQMALGLEAHRLRAASATMASLNEANTLRTALLQSVSHDLRTPLASIKASVTGLMSDDTVFSPTDRSSLLETIDASADRLDRVVGNLLDMSRLQAGATRALLAPTALEEVVAAALSAISAPLPRVRVDVSDSLPMVMTDAALLERALANVASNALAWSPPDTPVRIDAALVGSAVVLRVVDRGPGIPVGMRAKVFAPFQRLGDRSHDAGVGLGLAIAKGFVEATGGTIEIDDTPGGGSTFTFTMPVVQDTPLPREQDT